MTRGFKRVINSETATISEMATELAASIVAAASTLHEQHTERKILRVIEGISPVIFLGGTFKQRASMLSAAETWRGRCQSPTTNYPHELWLVWHEVNGLHSQFPNHSCSEQTCHICRPFTEVKVPLAQMFAEGWTVEREIKPTADVSYLVLARTAPRPRPGPPAGGV